MSEFEHDDRHRPAPPAQAIEQLFADLAQQLERSALLYGNAVYFDSERARRIRRDFDAAITKAESFFRRDDEPAPQPAAGSNRAQRIEAQIIAFIQDMGKAVTIDEVLEHLTACALGEPRASLITRMSRMASVGKLERSGRGYYELGTQAGD